MFCTAHEVPPPVQVPIDPVDPALQLNPAETGVTLVIAPGYVSVTATPARVRVTLLGFANTMLNWLLPPEPITLGENDLVTVGGPTTVIGATFEGWPEPIDEPIAPVWLV